jgi:hypothetical protein
MIAKSCAIPLAKLLPPLRVCLPETLSIAGGRYHELVYILAHVQDT